MLLWVLSPGTPAGVQHEDLSKTPPTLRRDSGGKSYHFEIYSEVLRNKSLSSRENYHITTLSDLEEAQLSNYSSRSFLSKDRGKKKKKD